MSKTKFYDFEGEQLIQARNKKEAIELAGLKDEEKEFLPYIEIISEQAALERLSKSTFEGETELIGFSEAKRIIDENSSRVLLMDSGLL